MIPSLQQLYDAKIIKSGDIICCLSLMGSIINHDFANRYCLAISYKYPCRYEFTLESMADYMGLMMADYYHYQVTDDDYFYTRIRGEYYKLSEDEIIEYMSINGIPYTTLIKKYNDLK